MFLTIFLRKILMIIKKKRMVLQSFNKTSQKLKQIKKKLDILKTNF